MNLTGYPITALCDRETVLPLHTRCKLNVHKTFRRRPRHLLNVLCTFNIRSVFSEKEPLDFVQSSVKTLKIRIRAASIDIALILFMLTLNRL